MQLILHRGDMKHEFQNGPDAVNCSATEFKHFKPDVQKAIQVVGSARYEELDGALYNRIYPTK